MSDNKPSVSGLMSQSHEVSRFENIFKKSVNTAYYNQLWGLDWVLWLNSSFQLPLNSFISYLTQESAKQGIILTEVIAIIEDFTLNLNVTIDGVRYRSSRNFKGGF